MDNMFLYLLKVSVGTMVLYLCYVLFFSRDTFYLRNRIFLLALPVISLVAPLLNVSNFLPETSVETVRTFNSIIMSEASLEAPISEELTSFDYSRVWTWLYFSISAILLIRMAFGIAQTVSIIRKGTLTNNSFPIIVMSEEEHSPFSFFPYVVIPRESFVSSDQSEILEHERAHVRQGHTFDLLFSELLIALLWLNPFIWLTKKALVLNHEYLADNYSLKKSSSEKEYQYKILNIPTQLINVPFAHNFSSLIKNRIVMINKRPTQNYAVLKNIIILPAVAILFLLFSSTSLPITDLVQSSSGFSGKWKYDHQRSNIGNGTYTWKEQFMNISQCTDSLIIHSIWEHKDRDDSEWTHRLSLDGTEVQGRQIKTVTNWSEDGENIKMIRTSYDRDFNRAVSTARITYELRENGNTLVVTEIVNIVPYTLVKVYKRVE